MEHFVPVAVGGLDVHVWVDLFNGCHTRNADGYSQFAWPDGGSYLQQENLTVLIFRIIKEQYNKVLSNAQQ